MDAVLNYSKLSNLVFYIPKKGPIPFLIYGRNVFSEITNLLVQKLANDLASIRQGNFEKI